MSNPNLSCDLLRQPTFEDTRYGTLPPTPTTVFRTPLLPRM